MDGGDKSQLEGEANIEDTETAIKRHPGYKARHKYEQSRLADAKGAAIQFANFHSTHRKPTTGDCNLSSYSIVSTGWNLQQYQESLEDIATYKTIQPPSDIPLSVKRSLNDRRYHKLRVTIGKHSENGVRELHILVWRAGELNIAKTLDEAQAPKKGLSRLLTSVLLLEVMPDKWTKANDEAVVHIAKYFGRLLERVPAQPGEIPSSPLWRLRNEAIMNSSDKLFMSMIIKPPIWVSAEKSFRISLKGWDPEGQQPCLNEYQTNITFSIDNVNCGIDIVIPHFERYTWLSNTVEAKAMKGPTESDPDVDLEAYEQGRWLAVLLIVSFEGFIGPEIDLITRARTMRARYSLRDTRTRKSL
jgi:hypothetical protein